MNTNIKNIIKKLAADEFADDEILYNRLKNAIQQVELEKNIPNPELHSLASLADVTLTSLESLYEPDDIISTGFKKLNSVLNGFYPGELVYVGGRPSMGKTMFLVNLALKMSTATPILYFSYDLPPKRLAARFIAAVSDVEPGKVLSRQIFGPMLLQVQHHSKELQKLPIYISSDFSNSVENMREFVEKQIAEKGIKVVMIDYVQLMGSLKQRNGREYELTNISRELKRMANELNICVIASSQLSRNPEQRSGDHKPKLSDLRDSGSLEQDADKVLMLHRAEYYGITTDGDGNSLLGLLELIISKNRSGPIGSIYLKRSSTFAKISEFGGFDDDIEISMKRMSEIDGLIGDIPITFTDNDDNSPF
ncbi:MAG: DnaB-like helicase C-terminal domain-containing protein [Bacteroidaceae bacterium]|nr:DnaB-like helicase C-terminal domain-containing protein [Bacteroidaceae bacterium]